MITASSRLSRRSLVDPHGQSVVSLASYGTRLHDVHLVIETIGRGRVRPARIMLWVDPDVDVRGLSPRLLRLRDRGLEIAASPAPYGPHTKYFPYVLAGTPHTSRLVTADDDTLYPTTWLEALERASAGTDDIVCLRAHRVGVADQDGLLPYNAWGPVTDRSPSPLTFATGVSGVSYPPAFLDELARRGDAFLRHCPHADDVWLHFVAVDRGHPVRQVGSRPRRFPEVRASQRVALHRSNTAQQANDAQIRSTYTPTVLRTLRHEGGHR